MSTSSSICMLNH